MQVLMATLVRMDVIRVAAVVLNLAVVYREIVEILLLDPLDRVVTRTRRVLRQVVVDVVEEVDIMVVEVVAGLAVEEAPVTRLLEVSRMAIMLVLVRVPSPMITLQLIHPRLFQVELLPLFRPLNPLVSLLSNQP